MRGISTFFRCSWFDWLIAMEQFDDVEMSSRLSGTGTFVDMTDSVGWRLLPRKAGQAVPRNDVRSLRIAFARRLDLWAGLCRSNLVLLFIDELLFCCPIERHPEDTRDLYLLGVLLICRIDCNGTV